MQYINNVYIKYNNAHIQLLPFIAKRTRNWIIINLNYVNEKEIKEKGISKNSSLCYSINCCLSSIFRLGAI